jgi:dTDP-4-dehydrorhamnose reductase
MTIQSHVGPLIMGASGRLGRALTRVWPANSFEPVWQTRDGAGGTLAWDILNEVPPELPPVSGVVVLAGVTCGSPNDLALNTTLARAGANLGLTLEVPVLVASSQAVYGPQQGLLREDAALHPAGEYGRAKAAMEAAVTAPHVTHLRLGNVAGCDALAGAVVRGNVVLDRFSDGQGPRRAMIGPADLVTVLVALLAAPARPRVLNVARPGIVAMADVLNAANIKFEWNSAPAGALPELALDVSLLLEICPLPWANAASMAHQGGL